MTDIPKRRPGDRILDRYCPDLSPKEREEAHERLRALARVLIRIERRLAEEAALTQPPSVDSPARHNKTRALKQLVEGDDLGAMGAAP
jgi:hypothetical protein